MSGRSQKLITNNYGSCAQDIRYGIPQGSIAFSFVYKWFTPLCRTYYVRGVCRRYFSSNSISAINIKLNEDMEKVQKWCTSNDMVINTMKSKSMILFDLIYCV